MPRTLQFYILVLLSVFFACSSKTGKPSVDVHIICAQSCAVGENIDASTVLEYEIPNGQIVGYLSTTLGPADDVVRNWRAIEYWASNPFATDHGVELKLACDYFQAYGKPLYIIRASQGSTNLQVEWAKDSESRNGLITRANNAIQELKDSLNPVIKGIYWNQGEGDANTQSYATNYQSNLEALATDLRSTISGASSAKFVTTILSDQRTEQPAFYSTVRKAVVNANIANYSWLSQDTVNPTPENDTHLNFDYQLFMAEKYYDLFYGASYELLSPIPTEDIIDLQFYWNPNEVAKMQTEPPEIDKNGDIVSWSPKDFPSTSGLSWVEFDKYVDNDGFFGLLFRLKARYRVRKIYIYDRNGSPTVRLKSADTDLTTWENIYKGVQSGWNKPITIDFTGNEKVISDLWVEANTVYYIPKIFIYAEKIEDVPDPVPQSLAQPIFGEYARVCTFTPTPVEATPKGTERIYLDTRWAVNSVAPAYLTPSNLTLKNIASFDAAFQAKKNRDGGVFIQLNLKEIPADVEFAFDGQDYSYEDKWLDTPSSDSENPLSYYTAARFYYAYAARYGSNICVPDTYLCLDTGNEIKKGLGYVDMIEIRNEIERWWAPAKALHRPTEMAAFFSAVIDGHNGAMGDGYGILTADPNMKIGFGGMIGANKWLAWWVIWEMARLRNQTYDEVAKLFFQIDWHHGSNDGDGQYDIPKTTGISPEADDTYGRFVDMVEARNKFFPYSRIVNGEFGYDWSQTSTNKAPPIVHNDVETTRTAWGIRNLLIGYWAGMHTLTWYMIRDLASTGPLYSTCGMTNHDYTTKHLIWYGWNMFVSRLYDCDTVEEIELGDVEVTCLRFTDSSNNTREKYAIWCNTANDNSKSNVTLPIGASMTKVNFITPFLNADEGVGYLLPISTNQVTIPIVDELPILIDASKETIVAPMAPESVTIVDKNPGSITFEWLSGDINSEHVEIKRGFSAGTEVLIDILAPNVLTYTDNYSGSERKIYYQIVAKNSSGENSFSFAVDMISNYTIDRTIKIDLNYSGQTPSDFNKVNSKKITTLKYTDGNPSGVQFELSTDWTWFEDNGVETGDDSGIVPDDVLKTNVYGSGVNKCIAYLTHLDASKHYVIEIIGSRDYLSSAKQAINIFGGDEIFDSAGNTDNSLIFYDITRVTSLDIIFKGYEGGGQVLSAVLIHEVK